MWICTEGRRCEDEGAGAHLQAKERPEQVLPSQPTDSLSWTQGELAPCLGLRENWGTVSVIQALQSVVRCWDSLANQTLSEQTRPLYNYL